MIEKLVDFLISILRAFQFFSVIYEYQAGLVLRFGKFNREAKKGLVWLIPFYIETLMAENVVREALPVPPQSLTTKCGKSIILSTIVSFTVSDVKKFLLEIEGRSAFVQDSALGIQSKFVLDRTWQELLECNLENELSKLIRKKAKDWGVDVLSVQIVDLTQSRSIRLISPIAPPYGY